jgi:SAM-dependent methyltransferase
VNEHRDTLQAAYDFDARRRDTNVFGGWRVEVIDSFLASLSPDASVLELGAGAGQAATYVGDKGFQITAMDLSPANVEYAAARGLDARVGDFTDPSFNIGLFDGVFALNSVLHVKKDLFPEVLSVIRRSLRVGGIALIVVWGGFNYEGTLDDEWTDPPRFFAFYSDEDFAALPTPGFNRLACHFRPDDAEGDLHPQILVLEAT